MCKSQIEAIAEADARTRDAGLPTYSELVSALQKITPYASWSISFDQKHCEQVKDKANALLARIPA